MKQVLLIAYNYPPQQIVGTVRPSKFVRYLPEFGWEPTVLTVSAGNTNESRGQNPAIYRVREWPHPLKTYERIMEQRAKRKGRGQEFAVKVNNPYAVAMSRPPRRIFDLKRIILSFLRLPDKELGWVLPAIWCGLKIIRQKKITHVITTAPPWSTQLVGLVLNRLTGVRWIADFRDPWTLHHKYTLNRNRVTDFIESRLIRSVLDHADFVISVTPTMTESLRKEYPYFPPEKFITLTNGFDPADFDGLVSQRNGEGSVVFSYLGSFKNGRTPDSFLRAMRTLIDEGTLEPKYVHVRFVGDVTVADGQSVPEMVRKFGLESNVTVEPLVPRREALQVSMNSDVLLVLTEQHAYARPLKFYDALAAGPIIFNIGSGGEVAEELAKTGRGVAADYMNQEDIRRGILECVSRSRTSERHGEPWRDPEIQCFNFQKLTGVLAGVLDSLEARTPNSAR